ncbi:MAG TPA: LPS export ABC transporter periplasmic protein LptC [Steroidobacteraceae bacterium]|nr:LPS export ABC transporter periplasmic protein LptC [Steroidobacteraceae bacterium]
MKNWSRTLKYVAAIAVIAVAYFIGTRGTDEDDTDAANATAPDPGYAARDAQLIETGYDGRERYRLNASVIRQRTESGVIELENLSMNYHVESAGEAPGGPASAAPASADVWHLTSDHGEVRANGDDVQLTGNVRVVGPAPGTGEPLSLTTESVRINTPTQFIETSAAVKLRWSGHELDARGMQADLKAGTLRLESDVNGHFFPK